MIQMTSPLSGRKGGVGDGILGGGVRRAGDAVQIFGELPPPAAGVGLVIERKADHHSQLQPRHRQGEESRHQCKDDEAGKIELKAGLKQL